MTTQQISTAQRRRMDLRGATNGNQRASGKVQMNLALFIPVKVG